MKPKKMKGWMLTVTDPEYDYIKHLVLILDKKKDEKLCRGRMQRVEIKFLDL